MMNRKLMTLVLVIAVAMPVMAQDDIPLLRPEERAAIDAQSEQFGQVVEPVLALAAKSTVRIWMGRKRLAYGTVIGDGRQVLTKWSQVDSVQGASLVVESSGGQVSPATLTGVYAEEDLAVLEISGEPLPPVVWSSDQPVLGEFMVAPQPNGRMAGFGVLSVMERNLRESDQAFLGVIGDLRFAGPGVRVNEVSKDSAAIAAGLRVGDVIMQVGERKISGLMELKSALVAVAPGDKVSLKIERDGKAKQLDVILGNRPDFPDIRDGRQAQMERMGTRLNRVRDSFSSVIQTDMSMEPNQVGGPVVNLKGQVIGVTLARADRTRSFVMSAATLKDLLKQEAQDPVIARAERANALAKQAQESRGRQVRVMPQGQPSPEQLQNHLEQMRRLMQFMQDEMDALEGR